MTGGREMPWFSVSHLLNSDQAESEYQEWVGDAPPLPPQFRSLVGINLKDRYQCTKHVFPHLRQAKRVVDYYLSHIVFPKLDATNDGEPVNFTPDKSEHQREDSVQGSDGGASGDDSEHVQHEGRVGRPQRQAAKLTSPIDFGDGDESSSGSGSDFMEEEEKRKGKKKKGEPETESEDDREDLDLAEEAVNDNLPSPMKSQPGQKKIDTRIKGGRKRKDASAEKAAAKQKGSTVVEVRPAMFFMPEL